MKLLDRLERRLRPVAIENLTLYLVIGQSFMLFLLWSGTLPGEKFENILLIPSAVLNGEAWRLLTFVFTPPTLNLLFAFFALYLFYIMGSALEGYWGTVRYNLYIAIAYIATIAGAFLPWALGYSSEQVASNVYITGSVFLAFAWLYPDFTILLFFILPVKVKWLALVTWAMYFWQFATGDSMTKALVLASVLNFALFFGKDIYKRARSGHRDMRAKAERFAEKEKPFHVCTVCGVTDKTHPKMEFRYCDQCVGGWGYCEQHIRNHEHKTAPPAKS